MRQTASSSTKRVLPMSASNTLRDGSNTMTPVLDQRKSARPTQPSEHTRWEDARSIRVLSYRGTAPPRGLDTTFCSCTRSWTCAKHPLPPHRTSHRQRWLSRNTPIHSPHSLSCTSDGTTPYASFCNNLPRSTFMNHTSTHDTHTHTISKHKCYKWSMFLLMTVSASRNKSCSGNELYI